MYYVCYQYTLIETNISAFIHLQNQLLIKNFQANKSEK